VRSRRHNALSQPPPEDGTATQFVRHSVPIQQIEDAAQRGGSAATSTEPIGGERAQAQDEDGAIDQRGAPGCETGEEPPEPVAAMEITCRGP
jgi:hypothetical protein